MLAPLPKMRDYQSRRHVGSQSLHDVLVRNPVKAVAPYPGVPKFARKREALGALGHSAMKRGIEACDLRKFRMPRGNRLDTFDTARHVQRRERDQLFQIVDQRRRDDFRARRDAPRRGRFDVPPRPRRGSFNRSNSSNSASTAILRTRKLAIGFGERAAVGVVDPDFSAARPDPVRRAFGHKRFDAAGNRVQRELARRRTDVDAQYDVTSRQA